MGIKKETQSFIVIIPIMLALIGITLILRVYLDSDHRRSDIKRVAENMGMIVIDPQATQKTVSCENCGCATASVDKGK